MKGDKSNKLQYSGAAIVAIVVANAGFQNTFFISIMCLNPKKSSIITDDGTV